MNSIKAFSKFITFPLHFSAFTNEKGDIKKSVSAPPSGWVNLTKSRPYNAMVWKKDLGDVKANGIGILTTGISLIDVDQPEKCNILERLKVDCKFWVKTKNGFHLIVKPFDRQSFVFMFSRWFLIPKPDIHTNNPTILYCK